MNRFFFHSIYLFLSVSNENEMHQSNKTNFTLCFLWHLLRPFSTYISPMPVDFLVTPSRVWNNTICRASFFPGARSRQVRPNVPEVGVRLVTGNECQCRVSRGNQPTRPSLYWKCYVVWVFCLNRMFIAGWATDFYILNVLWYNKSCKMRKCVLFIMKVADALVLRTGFK